MRTVILPALHAGQAKMAAGLKRWNHARMGRRFGKSQFGLDYLFTDKSGIPGALHGNPVGWFAPTNKLLGDAWREAKYLLRDIHTAKNEVDHRLELYGGGSVEFWTLDIDDPARGRKYAKIVVDEAAMVRDLLEKWQKSMRPTLTDYRGGAYFGSTTKGKNDFWRIEQELRKYAPDESAFFHAPSSDNPFLDPAEIEAAKRELPSLIFRQEYLAEYIDFGGGVVNPDWCQHGLPVETQLIVIGVDLAISQKTTADYTTLVAMTRERNSGRIFVLKAKRFRKPFIEILKEIEIMAHSFGDRLGGIYVETNQFQAAVVQELKRQTLLPVKGFTSDKDKLTRFLPLAARYEQRLVYHAPDLDPAYVEEITSFTGTAQDEHDDFVDAASAAYAGLPRFELTIASGGSRVINDQAMAGY